MRIAHLGNLAQNAALNATFQRQYLGWDADSYDYGRGCLMWSGLWEWGDLDLANVPSIAWVSDWAAIPVRNGWRRPTWQRIMGHTAAQPSFPTQEAFDAELHLAAPAPRFRHFDGYRLMPDEVVALVPDMSQQRRWPAIQELAKAYDVVVLYGPEAAAAVTLPKSTKVVTFECSTMRTVPQRDTPSCRVLAKAYQVADLCLITNADCHRAAQALGLAPERYAFIPHPVDTEGKFRPAAEAESGRAAQWFGGVYHDAYRAYRHEASTAPQDAAAKMRAALLAPHGTDLLFFAPARHALAIRDGPKANDKLLHAFAAYVHESEAAGFPKASLLLLHYGDAVAASKTLIDQLSIGHRVLWMPPLPKVQYAWLLQAADVVLDQFDERVGSFGTTTIEALACGKPCVTHVDPAVHDWCADVLPMPPVCNALSVEAIAGWLRCLAEPDVRAEWGEQGYRWVQQWQAPERVCAVWQETIERMMNA